MSRNLIMGAIIGDIVGSRFEFNNHRSKDFELFTPDCFFTDDTVMTVAVARAIIDSRESYVALGESAAVEMKVIGRNYPNCGYGGSFANWIFSPNPPHPYSSFGNGAAMRVSPCGIVAESLNEAELMSDSVTGVSHNHPEGIRGARAIAAAVYLAKTGTPKGVILRRMIARYGYDFNFSLDGIRDTYQFNETCQETVPQALEAFFESSSFEDALRNAISIGGDSDTLAAITCSVAGAFYGVPETLANQAKAYLDDDLNEIIEKFETLTI